MGVRMEANSSGPITREVMRHRVAAHHDWAQSLRSIADDLDTLLGSDAPQAIVIRTLETWRAGFVPRYGPTRDRLQAEGVAMHGPPTADLGGAL